MRSNKRMASHGVWRIAAMFFALTTALLWVYPRGGAMPPAPRASRLADGASLARLRAPVTRAGGAEDDLLEAALSSEDTQLTVRLIEKLGIVGSERAVEPLAMLVEDARPGVAEAALAAIGGIGGDLAARLLLSYCDAGRLRTRQAAVAALGLPEPELATVHQLPLSRVG